MFQAFNPFERVASNQYGVVGKNISRGSLVAFHYPTSHAQRPNPIHDPYPMVIITDIWPHMMRGVNLHYLTFPYIKTILTNSCNNMNYNYQGNIKSDAYIANAFRSYFRLGMRNVRKLDGEFLVRILSAVRSFSESEIERVKQEIRNQILQNTQIKADQLTKLNNRNINKNTNQLQQTLQRGVTEGLIYPQQMGNGTKSSNLAMPPGGPFSTGNM